MWCTTSADDQIYPVKYVETTKDTIPNAPIPTIIMSVLPEDTNLTTCKKTLTKLLSVRYCGYECTNYQFFNKHIGYKFHLPQLICIK